MDLNPRERHSSVAIVVLGGIEESGMERGDLVLGMVQADREVDACAAQLERLRCQRADARESCDRAILDAVILNVQSQLQYLLERRRVKADLRRYESERKVRTLHRAFSHSG